MAVLEKIRVKFGLLASIVIAIGLLLFIVDPSSVASAVQNMSSKYDVGDINGKSISYNDFQQDVQKFTTLNEMLTGGAAQGADQQAQIREQAWQDLIFKYLFVDNAQEAGIFVGDKEMVDLTVGKDVSPMIANNPMFQDENGVFAPERLSAFIQQMSQDQTGRAKLYWDFIQTSIRNGRYFEKYNSLFSGSKYQNPLMLKRTLAENNTTSNVEFVMIPFGYAQDSSIEVPSSEIRKYYDSHKKFFKQPSSRDIEYVVYEVKPSQKDIEETLTSVENLLGDFSTTANVKNFLTRNSDKPYADFWYKKGDLTSVSSEVENAVWDNSEAVSGVLTQDNTFYVTRVLESKNIPDSVYVRHILLQGEKAAHTADSLVAVLKKGENFSNVAAQYSLDQKSAADGVKGNLGWMTQAYMIPGFESILTADLNKPYIITTQYGTHIVEVTKETKPVLKKKVAIFVKEALASKETFNKVYSQANTFATLAAGSLNNFQKAVDSLKVYSHPVKQMLESSDNLGGINNTKEITRWAFENKAGAVSPIKTVDNNFFVIAAVTGTHKEGYADLKEVTPMIKDYLYQQKYAEKKKAEIAEQIKGMTDLEAIAEKLNTSVSKQADVAFASMGNQQLDPAFIGAISVAPLNQICGPVAGNIGVYVFKVTSRDTGSFYTEDDAKKNQMQIDNYMSRLIIPVMEQDAEVKDNRARFY